MGLICNTANKSLRRVGFLSLNFCSTPPAAALITRCNIFPYLPTEHLYHSATHVHLSKCYEKKKKSLELTHSTLKQNASIVYITSVLLIMLELENRKHKTMSSDSALIIWGYQQSLKKTENHLFQCPPMLKLEKRAQEWDKWLCKRTALGLFLTMNVVLSEHSDTTCRLTLFLLFLTRTATLTDWSEASWAI